MSPKWKFIVTHGCLGWGLSTYLAFTLVSIFIRHQSLDRANLLAGLIILPIVGLGWGAFMWSWTQQRKKR